MLSIEIDLEKFQQGDYKNIKKQIGDKIFNSCVLILVFFLFLYRLQWSIPDLINGQFTRTEYMIFAFVTLIYLFLLLIHQFIALANDLKLYFHPERIMNGRMLRILRNVEKVFEIIHHICLFTILFIYPLVWLLSFLGLQKKRLDHSA